MCPKEGNKDSERTTGHDLRGVAEDMRILDLISLEKRRLRSDLIAVYSFLMRGSRE